MKLTDREWKEFALEEIFSNNHGKRLTKNNRKIGLIPLLTASETLQGVSSFISNEDMTIYQDFISIDMFGHAFYHNYKCFGDDNIYFFTNSNISPQAKLFICTCISQNKLKYSYGNQFRQDNADKDKVLIPINEQGQPDYQFMEDYIKEMMTSKRQAYIEYASKKIEEKRREEKRRDRTIA